MPWTADASRARSFTQFELHELADRCPGRTDPSLQAILTEVMHLRQGKVTGAFHLPFAELTDEPTVRNAFRSRRAIAPLTIFKAHGALFSPHLVIRIFPEFHNSDIQLHETDCCDVGLNSFVLLHEDVRCGYVQRGEFKRLFKTAFFSEVRSSYRSPLLREMLGTRHEQPATLNLHTAFAAELLAV